MGLSGLGLAVPLSALAPSERYAKEQGKRHKKLTEWAWQLLLVGEALVPRARDRSRRRWQLRSP